MRKNLYIGGNKVGRGDPQLMPGINVMKSTFDLAQEPDWKDVITAVDQMSRLRRHLVPVWFPDSKGRNSKPLALQAKYLPVHKCLCQKGERM